MTEEYSSHEVINLSLDSVVFQKVTIVKRPRINEFSSDKQLERLPISSIAHLISDDMSDSDPEDSWISLLPFIADDDDCGDIMLNAHIV